jgi:acyl-CoA reductase-like NAD-dependent aldehyde dehydrogenase
MLLLMLINVLVHGFVKRFQNHPMLIAIKKIAPALAAGNSVVVKPSELAPCTLIDFARLLKEAGLPDGKCEYLCCR